MRKWRWIVIGVILITIALIAWVMYRRAGVAQATVDYSVNVSDPGSGLIEVKATVLPGLGLYLDVFLRDQVQNGENRVKSFTVTRRGEPLHWREVTADRRRISLGWGQGPVEIRYQVDPTWYKGRAPRSLMTSEFGYLRGMVFLYSPVEANAPDRSIVTASSVQFSLPSEWMLNSPWDVQRPISSAEHLGNTYFGVGKLISDQVQANGSTLSIGVYEGLGTEKANRYIRDVAAIFKTMAVTTGFAPNAKTDRWSVTILPDQTIHGGAAGAGSLVCSDDLGIITHEAFHWFNGETITTTDDAGWVKEGFTTYYQGKLLLKSGLWTEEQMADYLQGVKAKFDRTANGKTANLVEASRRLAASGDERDYNLVYYGGALLAAHLDQTLSQQGGSLDTIWSALNAKGQMISTESFVEVLKSIGGSKIAEDCAKILHGELLVSLIK